MKESLAVLTDRLAVELRLGAAAMRRPLPPERPRVQSAMAPRFWEELSLIVGIEAEQIIAVLSVLAPLLWLGQTALRCGS